MDGGRSWDTVQPYRSKFKFYPHIKPLTLDFRFKMMFEKLSGVFIWKFRASAFWIWILHMNGQILINWEQVYSPCSSSMSQKHITHFCCDLIFQFCTCFLESSQKSGRYRYIEFECRRINHFGGFMIWNSIFYVGFTIFFQCMGPFSLQLLIWLKYSHRIF